MAERNRNKLLEIKYMRFVKGSSITSKRKIHVNTERYKPIETVFTKIDKIAEKNSTKARNKKATMAPGQKIQQINNHRMTYGDINYLGANNAIFYFDRGIRKKQSNLLISLMNIYRNIKIKNRIIYIVNNNNCSCYTNI